MNYYNPFLQQMQPINMPNNYFIRVKSEAEAWNYPVSPGNSLTFKDDNAPYIYIKTMGFSQLDRPIFEKWRLTKEDAPINEPKSDTPITPSLTEIEGQINEIRALYDDLKGKVEAIDKPVKKTVKKEVTDNDSE